VIDYIDDGYVEDGYLAAEKGMHGELSFRFRPLLPEQRDGIDQVTIKEGSVKGCRAIAAAVAKQLQSWSLKDKSGGDVSITVGNVSRLRPRLFDKLWAVIAGRIPSEVKPDAAAEDAGDYVTSLLEGPDAKREADAKN
jgi:hypothetical protein